MDTVEQDQVHLALNKAYFYLKFRPRTEKEVHDYLQKKGERYHWKNSVTEKAVASLKENNFINDADFVEWFVHQRSTGKPKSAFALSHELQRLGVHKDIITMFFEENPLNEDDLAIKALSRRWSRFKTLEKKERFKKAAEFLSRRGFNFEKIKKSIEKLEET